VKQTTRHVPLQDFPSLFAMEGHTGLVGVFFASIWFAIVALYVPATLTSYWLFAMAIVFAFFFLSWVSLIASNYLAWKIVRIDDLSGSTMLPWSRDKLELRVRQLISLLSAGYVIAFSALIWLTGGIASPFVPFYIVIFSFTICRMVLTRQIIVVALFFLCAIFFACIARELGPWPLPQSEALNIQRSALVSIVHITFLCASLLAPVFSLYLVNLRATKHLLDDLYQRKISE
jgi:hypothetical protein